mmetsp:Transcript_39905/g.127606  ORF Transcript_39905/g.127606 Transcript_39905/m.127606 type:complete len:435 (-) Transcript_39905:6-1310(-)
MSSGVDAAAVRSELDKLKRERAALGAERMAFRREISEAASLGLTAAHRAALRPTMRPDSLLECPVSGVSGQGGGDEGMYYGSYLQVDTLLSCQQRESALHGRPAHDEMLFIIVHQVYELWFKQILFELGSVRDLMLESHVLERSMLQVSSRLDRVVEIQRVLLDQFRVLETMTALDFRDFRDVLTPASGFQSVQFRKLELLLGLKPAARAQTPEEFDSHFSPHDRGVMSAAAEEPSLLDALESWLGRAPGVAVGGVQFWPAYREVVEADLAARRAEAEAPGLPEDVAARMLEDCRRAEAAAASVLDEEEHAEQVAKGRRKLSHKAFQGAIMIMLYRDEPRFHVPFRVLTAFMNIDERLAQWRYSHMMLVHRTLGAQVGTGGSSGYHYLKATTSDRYRVFADLGMLSTFLVASHRIPKLEGALAAALDPYGASVQ